MRIDEELPNSSAEVKSAMSTANKPMSRIFRSKEESRINYNKMSKWYDMAAFFERKSREKGLQKLDVKKGERILANLIDDSGKIYGIDMAAYVLPNCIDCPIYVEKAVEEADFHPVAIAMPMWELPVEIVIVQKV